MWLILYFCVIKLEVSQLLGRAETSEVQNHTNSSVIFKLLQFFNNWSPKASVTRQGIDKDTHKDRRVLIKKIPKKQEDTLHRGG